MRALFLLRHANADGADTNDLERKLTPDGVQEAAKVGLYLGRRPSISFVLCSAADRCVETLLQVRPRLPAHARVQIDRALYLASSDRLLEAIAETDEEHGGVLVIAHNPGIATLASALATSGEAEARSRMLQGFPPAALARLDLDVEHWSEAWAAVARLSDFVRPSDLE